MGRHHPAQSLNRERAGRDSTEHPRPDPDRGPTIKIAEFAIAFLVIAGAFLLVLSYLESAVMAAIVVAALGLPIVAAFARGSAGAGAHRPSTS